jgi:hypothetical protein
VRSAWWEHAPFGFWLVDAVAPDTIVELGSHNGFSLFVFAEAVKRLELPTRISAIDSWEGDDHAGFYENAVYEGVVRIRDNDYADSTTLIRSYFSDAVGQFADGSIDLLHIDGRHAYEDVKEDFETYLPKLSDRGIVLFHDMNEHREGFGVWKFWAELADRYPSFSFDHGHGLGVLAVGENVPVRLSELLRLAIDRAPEIRQSYEQLGAKVSRQFYLEESGETLANTEEAFDGILGSASWKLTAPLRWAKSLLLRR